MPQKHTHRHTTRAPSDLIWGPSLPLYTYLPLAFIAIFSFPCPPSWTREMVTVALSHSPYYPLPALSFRHPSSELASKSISYPIPVDPGRLCIPAPGRAGKSPRPSHPPTLSEARNYPGGKSLGELQVQMPHFHRWGN